jgi:hypothetical protein
MIIDEVQKLRFATLEELRVFQTLRPETEVRRGLVSWDKRSSLISSGV